MDATWPGTDGIGESRRWMRDLGALLALPAMWVDHEPAEITSGLLSVLFSFLALRSAYVRFDDPGTGAPMEVWRPAGAVVPPELRLGLPSDGIAAPGMRSMDVAGTGLRVTSVPLALPWGAGLVVVSADRSDFPTAVESHLLGAAVGQAAIAIHTARRLARADEARAEAQELLARQNGVLRSLVDDVEPSLTRMAGSIRAAARLAAEVDASQRGPRASWPPSAVRRVPVDAATGRALTRREAEVLGLLAQGLSNKEIAGVMWLSHRTVERHVTSLYRKIGVARRSEATAFALRRGVV